MATIMLREFCHSRAGDKIDNVTLSLIAYRPTDYPIIAERVTTDEVRRYFGSMIQGSVQRFELPRIGALNFVLQRALGGGSTRSLRRDLHGKTLSGAFLDMTIDVPDGFSAPAGPF